ncbi:MAG: hypothetical protein EBZ91_03025 [Gammaproteobacteria bacterium]|nr:hypothetical protein [Gammaproteobacteria bacterium]
MSTKIRLSTVRGMRPSPRWVAWVGASLLAAGSLTGAWAQQAVPESLRVDNIRVEGLQRVSEGTVYNYLPVNIGDRLTPQRVREAIRALYDTNFFRDVELRWEGGTLIVAVLERPSIESFELKGNKDIGAGQPRAGEDRYQGRQARPYPPDQCGRQSDLQPGRYPRRFRAEDAELALLVPAGRSLFARVAAG